MKGSHNFAYLILCGIYLSFAVFCLIRFRKVRWPMFITGCVMAAGGPLNEFFYIPGYWDPVFIREFVIETGIRTWKFGFEDIISAFSFTVLSITLFELFLRKPAEFQVALEKIPTVRMSFIGLSTLLLSSFFFFIFRLSSFYACTLSLIIASSGILLLRPEFLKASLLAALSSAIIYWLVLRLIMKPLYPDIFIEMWTPEGLTGLMILGVPVEEPLWAFFGTLLAGPIYRVTHHRRQHRHR